MEYDTAILASVWRQRVATWVRVSRAESCVVLHPRTSYEWRKIHNSLNVELGDNPKFGFLN
ncbi:hypothetical protein SADUNF_Sadunf12G0093700 [Salix dunnii]|uniref:Uncharacterized protein n=1 Tax=Salix dunnii TaxID=1413687 RepID=A0A835MW92_9ROSI|nr:hypothetical protein SADUNF_Sadunf12G0093700 [Salix dunnii]